MNTTILQLVASLILAFSKQVRNCSFVWPSSRQNRIIKNVHFLNILLTTLMVVVVKSEIAAF